MNTTAIEAGKLRCRNLGNVLSGKALREPGGRLTPFQRDTLEALRFAGLSGYSRSNGTVSVTYLKPSPAGGHTEEERVLVTQRDLVTHLGNHDGT